MTKQKSTKRALLLSTLSLLLCVSMLIGTTYAWFTDSVTSGSNLIKAGNLDIVMEYWDGDSWEDAEGKVIPFVAADGRSEILWEPGCTYELAPFRIRNEGNLSTKLLVLLNGVKGDEKLMEVITFKTRINNIPESALNGSAANVFQKFENAEVDVLYGMPEGNVLFDWSLAGKGETTPGTGHTDTSPEFTVFGHMAEEAGNEYQTLSIEGVTITAIATQQAYESDSFNKYYDANAPYPEVATDDIGGGDSLTAGNVTVTLPANAPEGTYTLNITNKNVDKNDAGETTVSFDIELLKEGVKVEPVAGLAYKVEIDIGPRVLVADVSHKGNSIDDYSYDPAIGVVTFETESFSPFAVSYFEKITKVSNAEEFIEALTEIRTEAKLQIPGETGNKNYRENVILVLENDIVIDADTEFMYTDGNGAPLHFYGVKGILDLNGHNITVSSDALLSEKAYANAVLLIQYSNIDIVGEGSIVANNKSIPVYGWANSTVNIYGGNYVTNASDRNESAVYVNNPTVMINVYGGTYTDSEYAFNVHDSNCGTTPVIVLHEGITYADFLKNGTTNVTQSDINSGRIILAEGCVFEEYEENGVAMNKVVKK